MVIYSIRTEKPQYVWINFCPLENLSLMTFIPVIKRIWGLDNNNTVQKLGMGTLKSLQTFRNWYIKLNNSKENKIYSTITALN